MIQDSMQFAAVESGLRFYQAYDQSLSLWPIESEAFYVSTRFGKHISLQVGQRTHLRSFCFTEAFSALRCGIRISQRGAVNFVHMRSI